MTILNEPTNNKINVFTHFFFFIDIAIDEKSIGCFAQQENTLSSVKFELINTNTPGRCSAICDNAGYQFAEVMG